MVKPESELLESVDSLPRAVLGSLPGVSILVFDTDMVLRLADGGAFRDYGYDPAELVGKRLAEALPGESFEHLIPRYEAALNGKTDEFGYNIVSDPVNVHDLHATILHLIGIDHKRFTYRFEGRDYRLTDISGELVPKLMA